MPSTQWNDQEDAALMGLPLLARVLYLQGLRRHMDYTTGLVGIARGISYQQLREVAFIEPTTGRQDAGSPTIKAVRVALSQLMSAGLIESIGTKDKLVFRCILAALDQSVSKKEGRPRADLGQTYQGNEKERQDNDVEPRQGRPRADLGQTYQGNPQESGIREEISPTPESKGGAGGKARGARHARLDLSVLPTDLSPALWGDYLRMRTSIKHPLSTQTALDGIVRELNAGRLMGLSPDDMIRVAIENTWRGLKPEWVQRAMNHNDSGGPHAPHHEKPHARIQREQFERVAAYDWPDGAPF